MANRRPPCVVTFHDILQECHWLNNTILLRNLVRRTHVYGSCDMRALWESINSSLTPVFPKQDLVARASGFDHVKLLNLYLEEGLICQLPMQDTFCKLPCQEVDSILRRAVHKSQAPVHLRFLHNCLLTEGVKISLRGTRVAMLELSPRLGLRSLAPDIYQR